MVLQAITSSIGDKHSWPPYPGGHPDEVEAALLDSVFSLTAVYGSSAAVGPRAVVRRCGVTMLEDPSTVSRASLLRSTELVEETLSEPS